MVDEDKVSVQVGGIMTGNWMIAVAISIPAGDVAYAAAAGAWPDEVRFHSPVDAIAKSRVERAAKWLRRHVVRVERPGDPQILAVVAWRDPTLESHNPRLLAAYVITDTLWAAKALQPIQKSLSGELEDGIRRLGWSSNGLHEVLFHRVDKLLHCPADEDFVHGHSLGRFPTAGGRTVDLRVFRQKWDAAFDEGHPRLFTEHAVYRALDDDWRGRHDQARRRIRKTIADRRGSTRMIACSGTIVRASSSTT